jgi:hypothetical protein
MAGGEGQTGTISTHPPITGIIRIITLITHILILIALRYPTKYTRVP